MNPLLLQFLAFVGALAILALLVAGLLAGIYWPQVREALDLHLTKE